MAGPSQPLIVSLNHFLGNKGMRISRRYRRINLMKRRSRKASMAAGGGGLEGSKRPRNEVDRKVRTLKKLVPNCNDTTGLDGLFRETTDYILALEMKVKVMKVMVKVLSSSTIGGFDDSDD